MPLCPLNMTGRLSKVLFAATFGLSVLVVHSAAQAQPIGAGRPFRQVLPGRAVVLPAVNDGDESGEYSVTLPDNGDLRRKLELVRQQVEGEHYAEAARDLGKLLEDPEIHDFFLRGHEPRQGERSFLAEVRRMLLNLPERGQAAYRAQFEPAARARLARAIASGGEAPLREVVVRYPQTRAADEALYRLGLFLWDHGRPHSAAACLERLSSRPEAAAPFEPSLGRLLAGCSNRLDERGGMTATHAGWTTFRGDAARNRAVTAAAPFLAPRWSRPSTSDAAAQSALERAWEAHRQGMAACLPLPSPLAVGDLVFVRTLRGFATFDLRTGESRWSYPADDDATAGLDCALFGGPPEGTFSADDECVYLLQDSLPGEDAGRDGENVLSAHEHFLGREGKLRWLAGGSDGGAEPRLAGVYFQGPPLAYHSRLYVLAESKGALNLVVLDRSTGRMEWMQELALAEKRIGRGPQRMLLGAAPSISVEEIIVCPTARGAVIALDLTTRSLLWAYRYSGGAGRADAELDVFGSSSRLGQFDRWIDGTVTIADGCAILTPPESGDIHCLDLKTGEPLWTVPCGDSLFVACATKGHAVLVGRQSVTALQLADGKAAWRVPLAENSFPAGRGVFACSRYFLPVTTAAILEIDLSTGKIAAEHKSPREVPVGNLIWHKGLFISQNPFALEAFDEHARLAAEVQQRLAKVPDDPEALVRGADLDLASGNTLVAIDRLRRAHQAAPSPRARSKLISALLEGIRRKLPESEALSAELDGMIGP